MKQIVVVGGGGHAKVLISILKKIHQFDIIGYTDYINKGMILGVSYVGEDAMLQQIIQNNRDCAAAIGIGIVSISEMHKKLMANVADLGFHLPVIISPHAIVNEEVKIDRGTVIFDGAVINSGASIGAGVIINTNSTVEHDCRIGDDVHIAPGATLSGGVEIGESSLIGTGASVIQGLKIASHCLIGAGAVVIHNCVERGVYVGNPARQVH